MPEALRHDQSQRVDLALQQRIGGDGGAVGEADDALGARARGREMATPRRPTAGFDGVLTP
jgi:hypothetical protein